MTTTSKSLALERNAARSMIPKRMMPPRCDRDGIRLVSNWPVQPSRNFLPEPTINANKETSSYANDIIV